MILLFKKDIGTKVLLRDIFVKLYVQTLTHKEKNMYDMCRPVRQRDGKQLLYLKTMMMKMIKAA